MVRFTTGDGAWVAPLDHVLEVRPASTLRALPSPAPGVAGVLDHDGRAVPVLHALGAGDRHVLVVRSGTTVAGVLVEEVTGVVDVADDALGPKPLGQRQPLVEGTVRDGTRLAYVLDVAHLIVTAQSC